MLTKRIIPCLDVKDGNVVKGIHFLGLKEVGDPVALAKKYYLDGADELVFLDISATVEKRKTMVDIVKKVAKEIYIPFTVGGGISTIEDVRAMLMAGADKVSLNSAAIRNPDLIKEASKRFGNQCIVLAVDAKRRKDGSGWNVYIEGGRKDTHSILLLAIVSKNITSLCEQSVALQRLVDISMIQLVEHGINQIVILLLCVKQIRVILLYSRKNNIIENLRINVTIVNVLNVVVSKLNIVCCHNSA